MSVTSIQVLTCDRCDHFEEFRDEAKRPIWGKLWFRVPTKRLPTEIAHPAGDEQVDLCQVCSEAFYDWWIAPREGCADASPSAATEVVAPPASAMQTPAPVPPAPAFDQDTRARAISIARNNILVELSSAGIDIDPDKTMSVDARSEAIVDVILLSLGIEVPEPPKSRRPKTRRSRAGLTALPSEAADAISGMMAAAASGDEGKMRRPLETAQRHGVGFDGDDAA